MELTPFVPLRSALCILALARTELAEVLGRSRNNICEQFHLDTAKGFTWSILSGIVTIQTSVLYKLLEHGHARKHDTIEDILTVLSSHSMEWNIGSSHEPGCRMSYTTQSEGFHTSQRDIEKHHRIDRSSVLVAHSLLFPLVSLPVSDMYLKLASILAQSSTHSLTQFPFPVVSLSNTTFRV